MPLHIEISTGSSVPIYRQIMDQVRWAVASGELALEEQLPSVRALAERLVLNHNTVARAYLELIRDGVIESRQGRGVFVVRRRQVFTKTERRRRLDLALQTLLSEALALDFSQEEIREALERKLNQMEEGQAKAPAEGSHE